MTATLIGEGLDTDLDDEVVLAPPPPRCDGVNEHGEDCTRPAEFKTHTRCCYTIFLFCEDCLYITMGIMKRTRPGHDCKKCSHKIMEPEKHLVFDGRL